MPNVASLATRPAVDACEARVAGGQAVNAGGTCAALKRDRARCPDRHAMFCTRCSARDVLHARRPPGDVLQIRARRSLTVRWAEARLPYRAHQLAGQRHSPLRRVRGPFARVIVGRDGPGDEYSGSTCAAEFRFTFEPLLHPTSLDRHTIYSLDVGFKLGRYDAVHRVPSSDANGPISRSVSRAMDVRFRILPSRSRIARRSCY